MRLWTISLSTLALTTSMLTWAAEDRAHASGGQGLVEVSGDNKLMRDGGPWVPHGVVQIAFVAPPNAQTGVFTEAYKHYNPGDYDAMVGLKIDSVRMQVSQPAWDPQNKLYKGNDEFRARVLDAVKAARQRGLTVIVSMQDETQSGETTPTRLPNESTRRAWKQLAPNFATDLGVMYELLNEPQPNATSANWIAWAEAMNNTLKTVRDQKSLNVVIADGLLFGERLTGAPALKDPLSSTLGHGRVVYASHPYAHDASGLTEKAWDSRFGDFAKDHPVIVTEWTTSKNFYCQGNMEDYAQRFINYLQKKNVGLTAFAWDFSGTEFGSTFQGFPPKPTTFKDKRCGQEGFGPGELILNWYNPGHGGR